jgi:hypothetical protein
MRNLFAGLACTLLLVFAAGAATSKDRIEWHRPAVTEAAREKMLGTWYGEHQADDGSRKRWVIVRSVDGSYVADFEIIDISGAARRQSEFGIWGIRYPIYFTSVQGFDEDRQRYPADTSDPSLYDAYRVIAQDNDRFQYVSYTSGNTFEVRRVADGFTLDTAAH